MRMVTQIQEQEEFHLEEIQHAMPLKVNNLCGAAQMVYSLSNGKYQVPTLNSP